MALTTDELALRTALDDLATAQPDAPTDRLTGVRRRYVRRRRAQGLGAATASAVAVVAVLLGLGVVPTPSPNVQPAHRNLPSWALPWPDHRDPSTGVLREQALAAWQVHTNGSVTDPFYAPRRVIWYVTSPVNDDKQIAVVFEVETDSGDKRLVAGYLSDRSAASKAENWILYDTSAPLMEPLRSHNNQPPIVSFYVPMSTGTGENEIVVVTSPAAKQVYVGYGGGMHVLSEGFATATATHVRDKVSVAVEDSAGRVLNGGNVGLPGVDDSQVPELEPVAPFVEAGAGYALGPINGQGPSFEVDESTPRQGPTTIVARCYGGSTIRVSLDADTAAQTVTIPCDDQQHAVPGPAWLSQSRVDVGGQGLQGHSIGVKASQFVAWRIAVTSRGG